jgi:outer membrane protein TolC
MTIFRSSAKNAFVLFCAANNLGCLVSCLVFLLPFCVAIPAFAQQTQKLTLADALQMAERQNLDLIAARAQRAVANAGVKIAGERPNPTGNVNVLRDDPHEGWWFDQPIDVSGKRKRRIELAQAQGVLTDDDISAIERLTRQSVRDAFFALALARSTTA